MKLHDPRGLPVMYPFEAYVTEASASNANRLANICRHALRQGVRWHLAKHEPISRAADTFNRGRHHARAACGCAGEERLDRLLRENRRNSRAVWVFLRQKLVWISPPALCSKETRNRLDGCGPEPDLGRSRGAPEG